MAYQLGGYKKRGGGRLKKVFFVVVLLQIAAVGAYFYFTGKANSSNRSSDDAMMPSPAAPAPAGPAAPSPAAPAMPAVSTPETQALVSDAQAAFDAGQLLDAKQRLDKLVASTSDAEAVRLLGEVNIKLLKSPILMPGKEYYAIQSGDFLQKIAKNYNTTVELIKEINGMQTDTIRSGARIMVFNGNFSIHVSKARNTLDLMSGNTLFKRYRVGTGKFGKTPAIEFTIVDKIIEPPWTRPTDNKQIEYGDPENVLGTRWMKIVSAEHPEITGFGIHGTWERDSVGSQSSAGCIRMLNEDVEELFDLVPRNTSVFINE